MKIKVGRWGRPNGVPIDDRKCRTCYKLEDEGLPIKMTREKFQRKQNDICSMEKIVGSTLELSAKAFFSLDKYQLKKYGLRNSVFDIQLIEHKKSPRYQTNPCAYSCSFTFHTSYKNDKNGKIGHWGGGFGGGTLSKCFNNLL